MTTSALTQDKSGEEVPSWPGPWHEFSHKEITDHLKAGYTAILDLEGVQVALQTRGGDTVLIEDLTFDGEHEIIGEGRSWTPEQALSAALNPEEPEPLPGV